MGADGIEPPTAAPDRDIWLGRRDHALLTLAIQTGLRVSELTGLRRGDLALSTGPHVRCHGKGRKQRATPLTTSTVTVLREWLAAHPGEPDSPLFPSRNGTPLSTDTVSWLITKYATTAAVRCPTLTRSQLPSATDSRQPKPTDGNRRKHR